MNWDFLELMTEEQKLGLILYLIGQGGVVIETAFVNSDEGDVLTHELLQISCGDYSVYSHPEPLTHPLRPATGAELNKTVN